MISCYPEYLKKSMLFIHVYNQSLTLTFETGGPVGLPLSQVTWTHPFSNSGKICKWQELMATGMLETILQYF